jgi:predicted acylesterase/phospholipase RssA
MTPIYSMLSSLAKHDLEEADIIIQPKLPKMNPLDFVEAKKIIDIGYQETMAVFAKFAVRDHENK